MEYKLKVNIKEEVIDKIESITSGFDDEFAGFLFGDVNDEITINDIQFPKQEVSTGSVDFDMKSVINMRKDNPNWKNLLGIWHSHNNMSSYFSGGEGDESHIKFISNGKDLTVFIVSSHKDNIFDHKCKVIIRKPIHITIDDVKLNIIRNGNDKFIQEIKKLIIHKKPVNVKEEGILYIFSPKSKELIIKNVSYIEVENVKSIPAYIYKGSGIDNGSWYVIFNCDNFKEAKIMTNTIKEWLGNHQTFNYINQKELYHYGY